MIDEKLNPVAWSTFMYELADAQEHLSNLYQQITTSDDIDEVDFQMQLAHIYAHLNRAWNGRNATDSLVEDETLRGEWSRFPVDIEPL